MKKSTLLLLFVCLFGCEEKPKTIEVKVNGVPVQSPSERKIDPKEAESKLSEWKAKWFDEHGEFRNKVWSNLTMAASEAENISFNFPGTDAAKKAKVYEAKLVDSKQEARDNDMFPTLSSLE